MNDVAVIGAGAWGTALAIQSARAGLRTVLWAHDPARLDPSRRDPRLPPGVQLTGRMPDARLTLLAVPVQHLRAVAAQLPDSAAILICAKGIEAGSLMLPLEILHDLARARRAGVLTGPNFAHEIAAGLPAAAVIASQHADLRAEAAAALATPTFRLYGNDDPIGAGVGGAAKNVIAIAAGAVIGAGLGENARAGMVTRGLAELSRLATALGGRAETTAGLSGLGDLLLTCTGQSSRNFRLGHALGQGASLAEALANRTEVTEGVATAPALVARAAQAGIAMPICEAVAAIVTGHASVADTVAAVLARRLRDE